MSAFREYVTSSAFALTVSSRQVEALCMLHQTNGMWCTLATAQALARKGLIEWRRVDGENGVANGHAWDGGAHKVHESARVRLTEAGRLLIPLIKLAGLYQTLPDKSQFVNDGDGLSVEVTRKEPQP